MSVLVQIFAAIVAAGMVLVGFGCLTDARTFAAGAIFATNGVLLFGLTVIYAQLVLIRSALAMRVDNNGKLLARSGMHDEDVILWGRAAVWMARHGAPPLVRKLVTPADYAADEAAYLFDEQQAAMRGEDLALEIGRDADRGL